MRLASIALRLLDLCYPRRCPACDRFHERDGHLCPECERMMQDLETSPRCGRCARPVPLPGSPCPICHDNGMPHYQRMLALGVLREPLRSVIHRIKYGKQWHLAEAMADRMVDAHDLQSWLSEADALVPVPLHPRRQAERGFNQSDVLARQIAKRCRLPVVTPVARTRDTPTQTALHARDKRTANLRDAFAVTDPSAIHGKHLVIVDDVSTTGATLGSLAHAMRGARPASLSAVVLAVADPRGRDFAYL